MSDAGVGAESGDAEGGGALRRGGGIHPAEEFALSAPRRGCFPPRRRDLIPLSVPAAQIPARTGRCEGTRRRGDVEQFCGNLVFDEAGERVGARPTVQHTLACVQDIELLFRTGDGDIGEPPLLGHFGGGLD